MLTVKQEKFTNEYFKSGNATKSAKLAGYSAKTAYSAGGRLLKNVEISKRIQELKDQATSDAVASVTERKAVLSQIIRGKLTDFIKPVGDSISIELKPNAALEAVTIEDWRGGPDDRASSRISKVKLHNPITATAELNKMDGSYPQEREKPLVEIINSFKFVMPDGTILIPRQLIDSNRT